jgi:hypothetical protein
MTMFKRSLAVPAATILALAMVMPAAASGPIREYQPGVTINFGAGDACAFPATMVVDSNAYALTFDGWQLFTGRGTVTVTNDSTGASVDANISGPAMYIYNDDGTISIRGGGPWLIFNFAGDPWGPGMWLTAGRLNIEVEADGSFGTFILLGTRTDVCALLG